MWNDESIICNSLQDNTLMEKDKKKKPEVDPGNVIAGQYVPDPPTKHGNVIVGKYSLYIPTNPNIVLS